MSRSPTPRLKGADLSPQDYPASSDDEGSSIAGDSDQGLEVARSLGALAIVPYIAEEGPALDAQLSAALSELEELDDISADELDMTAASRTAIGLRCSSMPAFPERQALVLQSREADPEPPCQDDATNRGHGDSQVRQPVLHTLVSGHASDMMCGVSSSATQAQAGQERQHPQARHPLLPCLFGRLLMIPSTSSSLYNASRCPQGPPCRRVAQLCLPGT